jgi:hypothetical protein
MMYPITSQAQHLLSLLESFDLGANYNVRASWDSLIQRVQ